MPIEQVRGDTTSRYESFEGLRGKEDQQKLHDARILIAGCGAGSNIAPHIARAGIGTSGLILIADPGLVDLRNIDRQFYTPANIGQNKAEALVSNIQSIEPDVKTRAIREGITLEDVPNLVSEVDIVVEMVDVAHPDVSMALHLEAQRQAKPLVTGLDLGDDIIAFVFDYRNPNQVSLQQFLGLPSEVNLKDVEQLSPLAIAAQMVIGQQGCQFSSYSEAEQFYNSDFFVDSENMTRLLSKLSPDMVIALEKMLSGEVSHIPQTDIAGALLGLTHAKIIKEILLGNTVCVAPDAIAINLTAAIHGIK